MGVYRRLMPRSGIGLCYHLAADRPRPHVRHPFKTPAQLEADLLYVREHFRVLSYPEYAAARAAGTGPGPLDVVLTFDDAFAECFSVVRPLLLKHGLSAIFFVPTDALDNRLMLDFNQVALSLARMEEMGPAWSLETLNGASGVLGRAFPTAAAWAEWITSLRYGGERETVERVREVLGVDVEGYLRDERPYLTTREVEVMAAEGFTIGGHTLSHRVLRFCTPGEVEAELAGSCRIVSEITGSRDVPFAFPVTGNGVDRDLLAGIRARHPYVGLLWALGLRRDRDFIAPRVWTDPPPADGGARTSLPECFRRSYAAQALVGLGGRLRGGASPRRSDP
jgi:peptidoglycan/xylan/chitin deacetylase (PgdA/CDA1 family)